MTACKIPDPSAPRVKYRYTSYQYKYHPRPTHNPAKNQTKHDSLRIFFNSNDLIKPTNLQTQPLDHNKNKMIQFNENSIKTYVVNSTNSEQWYSKEEISSFRKTFPLCEQQARCRRQFVGSILSQQAEHKKAGMSDPKGLKMMSKACSKTATQRARQTAIENQKESLVQQDQPITTDQRMLIKQTTLRSVAAKTA